METIYLYLPENQKLTSEIIFPGLGALRKVQSFRRLFLTLHLVVKSSDYPKVELIQICGFNGWELSQTSFTFNENDNGDKMLTWKFHSLLKFKDVIDRDTVIVYLDLKDCETGKCQLVTGSYAGTYIRISEESDALTYWESCLIL